jgi:hypothetical protein
VAVDLCCFKGHCQQLCFVWLGAIAACGLALGRVFCRGWWAGQSGPCGIGEAPAIGGGDYFYFIKKISQENYDKVKKQKNRKARLPALLF